MMRKIRITQTWWWTVPWNTNRLPSPRSIEGWRWPSGFRYSEVQKIPVERNDFYWTVINGCTDRFRVLAGSFSNFEKEVISVSRSILAYCSPILVGGLNSPVDHARGVSIRWAIEQGPKSRESLLAYTSLSSYGYELTDWGRRPRRPKLKLLYLFGRMSNGPMAYSCDYTDFLFGPSGL